MGCHVRIEIRGVGTFYPASAPHDRFLTEHRYKARRYHNSNNADEHVRMWTKTLTDLGHEIDAFVIDAD